jgi:4-amino-4-deoxy-L-arabinose transferase-like glycosyltransferase
VEGAGTIGRGLTGRQNGEQGSPAKRIANHVRGTNLRHMRSFYGRLLVLLAAAAVVYLWGNARVGLWDRDEPRYAEASQQMLQSGDWVVPRFLDELRARKPPLIYWCQASAMAVLGQTAFAARLPSVIAMLLTLAIVAETVRLVAGKTHALWTVFILASSLWVICLAKIALTDSVMLLWTAIAEICLYRIWNDVSRSGSGWIEWIVLAVATGLGVLTKGPIILVLIGTALALAAFELIDRRRLPRLSLRTVLQVVVAIAIVALIGGSWLYLVDRRAPGFLRLMLAEALGHVETGREGHGGWPGEQFAMIWATYMPWSLLLPMAMVIGWKRRAEPATRYALAAVIGPWLMMEFCIRTKLPHYMLPAFGPLAFLTAGAILNCLDGRERDAATPAFLFFAGVWSAAMVLVGCLPWVATRWFSHLPWGAMVAVMLGSIVYAGFVLTAFHRHRPKAAFAGMGIGMLSLFALAYGVYLPRCDFLRLSIETADILKARGATEPGEELMLDYREPSLAFYQGGTIRERYFGDGKSNYLALSNRPHWTRWMVITRTAWNETEPASRALLRPSPSFHGLAYADGGRVVDVLVVEYPGATISQEKPR